MIHRLLNPLLALGLLLVPHALASDSATEAWRFGNHPRLSQRALMQDAAIPGSAANVALLARADRILAEPLKVPEQGGQWIFYYACPEHDCALQLRGTQHVCPTCGKAYDDERTLLAYETRRHDVLNGAVLTLAQAWHCSGRDDDAREVWRVLQRYAELHPTWKRHDRWGRKGMLAVIGGKRYSQSLDDAYGIIKLAQAYDLIYDWSGITPQARERVETDFFAATVASIYQMYLVYDGRNNHMTWFNAAAATVGTVLGRTDMLERALNGPKGLRVQFVESVTAEGLWYEGATAYHFYALQAILQTVDAVQGGGVDLTGNPVLKKLFRTPLELAYPNGQLPAINDSDRSSIAGHRRIYAFAAQTWPDADLKAFAESGTLPTYPSRLYEDAGLVYLRRGSGIRAVTAILDFGQHGGHHGHPDKLNLMLYAQGQELFLDPGRLTYRCPEHTSWTRQSVAHNTVVIDRSSQRAKAGMMLQFVPGPMFDIAVARADEVYRGVSLERALVLFDHVLIDLFRVSSQQTHTLDWLLHGNASLTVNGVGEPYRPPLGNESGYQHLTNLMRHDSAALLIANWTFPKGVFVRTQVVGYEGDSTFTGSGIGYALTDRVPFLLIRRQAAHSVFAAVHDLSGDGTAAGTPRLACTETSAILTVPLNGRPCTVTWPTGDAPLAVTHSPTSEIPFVGDKHDAGL